MPFSSIRKTRPQRNFREAWYVKTQRKVQRMCHVQRFTTCSASRKSAFTQPFFSSKMKTDSLRKRVQRGKRGFYLLLQPQQRSSHAGTSVPVHLHCGTWSYLCCQRFSRDRSSLLLLPPKSVANGKGPQGKQKHKQLLWSRSLTVFVVLKKNHIYMPDKQ